MSGGRGFAMLEAELGRWAEAGLSASFWLRDDDAVAATPALDRLLRLASGHGAPLMLAIIPLRLEPSLGSRLAREDRITPAVHGAFHADHAPAGRKSEETAPERGEAAIRAELALARAALVAHFGIGAGRWYVPPWNRIAAPVAGWLPELGFEGLSTFGPNRVLGRPELAELNATVDLVDWRGGRGGHAPDWVAERVAEALAARRAGDPSAPVGILAHHLVHDETAWESLGQLLSVVARHEAAGWRDPSELALSRISA